MSCSPGSSHTMTNSGSICSTGENSTHLLLYLQNHHPHASTSTNSVCLTRSMNSADINCSEQSRHIRSCTSPLLQQSAHHVKWLLPLAHQKMTKEAETVSCCVRNRQNRFWLDFVNLLLSISDLVQNVQKGYLWNYKSCKGVNFTTLCTLWWSTTVPNFTFLWAVFMLQMYSNTSLNFKAVFLRIGFQKMTLYTFSL